MMSNIIDSLLIYELVVCALIYIYINAKPTIIYSKSMIW